jgi:hypothetical protein
MRRIVRKILERLYQLPSSEVANAVAFFGICINIALLLATGVLAFYSYRQWAAVNDTLQEIKKQTPAVIKSGDAAESAAKTAKEEAAASDASTRATLSEMKKQSGAAQVLAGATQAATATAMRQLDLSERPSLLIADTKIRGLSVNSFAQVSYSIDVLVDNAGRSPATNVVLIPSLALPPGYAGSIPAELEKTCHSADRVGPLSGEMVPQGEKGYRLNRNTFGTEGGSLRDAMRSAFVDPQSGNRMLSPILVVCVLYRSSISSQVHHTALMYDASIIFSPDEATEIQEGLVPKDGVFVVRSDRISLHKQDVINGLAD